MSVAIASESAAEDLEQLAEALAALGSPVRISLLEGIRSPKPLKDIRVKRPGPDPEGLPRLISRQGVKEHLEKLLEVGVVLSDAAKKAPESGATYVVNHQAIYALAERLRDLARLRAVPELGLATIPAQEAGEPRNRQGPGLALVKGLEEGRLFPLAPTGAGGSRWIIGRRRGVHISLDFDPFVSSENTAIHFEGGAYAVEDLPHSRNGTTLNFAPIGKGVRVPLSSGDVIGVGRCYLVFRA